MTNEKTNRRLQSALEWSETIRESYYARLHRSSWAIGHRGLHSSDIEWVLGSSAHDRGMKSEMGIMLDIIRDDERGL